jgi:hypothetical protein
MVAKRFFYVCAGIFLLAAAYHLGALSAVAQSGDVVSCASVKENQDATSAVIGRVFCFQPTSTPPIVCYASVPIPGTSPVVACGIAGSGYPMAVLANGEVWRHGGTAWELMTTYRTGATPSTQESWGGVKAKYRSEGEAKQAQGK